MQELNIQMRKERVCSISEEDRESERAMLTWFLNLMERIYEYGHERDAQGK